MGPTTMVIVAISVFTFDTILVRETELKANGNVPTLLRVLIFILLLSMVHLKTSAVLLFQCGYIVRYRKRGPVEIEN